MVRRLIRDPPSPPSTDGDFASDASQVDLYSIYGSPAPTAYVGPGHTNDETFNDQSSVAIVSLLD